MKFGGGKLFVAVATASGLLVTACASGEPGAEPTVDAAEETEDAAEEEVDAAEASPETGGEVVITHWGGASAEAMREYFFNSFEEETGIQVIEDTLPLPAQVKAQVDTNSVEWDIVAAGLDYIEQLNAEGEYYDPIPYDELTPAYVEGLVDESVLEHGVGAYFFSWVIANRTDAFDGDGPQTWAEFWDVEAFPGARSFTGTPIAGTEAALLADGVPRDELYPLDFDRAFAKMDELKPHVRSFWESGTEAPQMLANEEITSAIVYHSRIPALQAEGVPIDFDYVDGILAQDLWSLVHGSPNRENAILLLDWMLDPERQADFARAVYNGPTNADAFDYLSEEEARNLPSHPDNIKTQAVYDAAWWAPHQADIRERYSEWLLE